MKCSRLRCFAVGALCAGACFSCDPKGKSAPSPHSDPVEAGSPAPSKPQAAKAEQTSEPAQAAIQAARPASPKHAAVLQWSQALNSKDYAAMEKLYAPQVLFYGKKMTREQVIAAKRAALTHSPDYRQGLNLVRIEEQAHGFTAHFEKSWTGGKAPVRARLEFAEVPGGFALTVETDASTDAALRIPTKEGCASAAFAAAEAQPIVREDRARVAREYPLVSPGGLIYEETAHSVHGAIGYSHPERFESRWWLEVNDGNLTVTNALTMDAFRFTPEELARVRRACGH